MKKSLALIPGILGDNTLWTPVIQTMPTEYEHHFIDITQEKTLEIMTKKIQPLTPPNTVLIGFSLGARVALQAYLLTPSHYSGLVLIASAPGVLTPKLKQFFSTAISEIQRGLFEQFLEADFHTDVAIEHQNNEMLKTTLLNMMRRQGPEVALRQLEAMLHSQGTFDLSKIHCPTLLLRGAKDESINLVRYEQILQELPKPHSVIIPHAAHYVLLENPATTANALHQWLTQI